MLEGFMKWFKSEPCLETPIDWTFSLPHLFLLLTIIALLVLAYCISPKKNKVGINITKIVIILGLFIFEVARIFREAYMFNLNHGSLTGFDWINAISFHMCAMMTWFTMFTLILSFFLKKDNKLLNILYNILGGCAGIGASTVFVITKILDGYKPIWYFTNIQTIIIHFLLVFAPLYLIRIGEFRPNIKNLFHTYTGYVCIGSVAMTMSIINNQNFAFAFEISEVPFVNLVGFPFHYILIMLFMIVLALIFYSVYEFILCRKLDYKSEYSTFYKLSTFFVDFIGMVILLSFAFIIGKEEKDMRGLYCLLAFVYIVIMITFISKNEDYMVNHYDVNNKRKNITQIIILLIVNLPLGILYLTKYLKNKKASLA